MKKKRRFLKRFAAVLLVCFLLLLVEGLRSNYSIKVERYEFTSDKVVNPVRVVFLSDLHGREFGNENARLLEKLRTASPDLIAFCGDIFNEDADEAEITAMCDLIRHTAEIAPVYYCMGNHEYQYRKQNGNGIRPRIKSAGAIVLDCEFVDVDINGTPLRIGGYMGYYRQPGMFSNDTKQWEIEKDFSNTFEDTERLKLLLNHIPTTWLDWNYRDKYPVDLVLSGHYHGGVIRIPLFEQGLYAPYVGWFPPYTKGTYKGEKATCILTTGMAGCYGIPRFFNLPEIVIVDLMP